MPTNRAVRMRERTNRLHKRRKQTYSGKTGNGTAACCEAIIPEKSWKNRVATPKAARRVQTRRRSTTSHPVPAADGIRRTMRKSSPAMKICEKRQFRLEEMTLTTYKNIDAAIVCSHILADPSCVKYAFRTPPTDSSDSGWQFLCDKKSHSGKDAKVISADDLVHLIPSGASILGTPMRLCLRKELLASSPISVSTVTRFFTTP